MKDDSKWLEKRKRNRLLTGYIYYYLSYIKKGIIDNAIIDQEIKLFQKFVFENCRMIIASKRISLKFKVELLLLVISKKSFCKMLKVKTRR